MVNSSTCPFPISPRAPGQEDEHQDSFTGRLVGAILVAGQIIKCNILYSLLYYNILYGDILYCDMLLYYNLIE